MKIASIAYIYDGDLVTCIQKFNKNNTGSDQWVREGNKHKTSSTGKVKDGRETNTTINRNLVT